MSASADPHPVGGPSPLSQCQDTIRVCDLLLLAHVADGAQWPSPTSTPVRQPVRVSISVPYDLRPAAASDDISQSINYGALSKRVLASVVEDEEDSASTSSTPTTSARQCQFRSLERLADHIFATCFAAFPEIGRVSLDVVKPRALPYADAVRVRSERARDGCSRRLAPERFEIVRLACNVVVGLNPCEREDKQLVYFDVDVSTRPLTSRTRTPMPTVETEDEDVVAFDFRRLAKDIRQVRALSSSSRWTTTRVRRK